MENHVSAVVCEVGRWSNLLQDTAGGKLH